MQVYVGIHSKNVMTAKPFFFYTLVGHYGVSFAVSVTAFTL